MMKISRTSAFSLAECLISILLLSLTMVVSISLFFDASSFSGSDQHRREALELADSRMESIKAMPWSSIISVNYTDVFGGISAADQVNVTSPALINGNNYPNIKQVQVILSWQEKANTLPEKQKISLTTFIAQ